MVGITTVTPSNYKLPVRILVCQLQINPYNRMSTMYETEIFLNSNLMIPDFPHIMKIRLAPLKFLYYEENLVSSNLNSKLLWFYSVRPKIHTYLKTQISTTNQLKLNTVKIACLKSSQLSCFWKSNYYGESYKIYSISVLN